MIQNIFTEADFDRAMGDFFGRAVIQVPVTTTISNTYGAPTYTSGTGVQKKLYFLRMSQKFDFQEMGFLEQGDSIAVAKFSEGIVRNDLIYTDGTNYTITSIDGNSTTISITTSAIHGLSAGDSILILGTTNYNGVYTVATTPTTATLTIANTSHDLAAETTGQLVKSYRRYRVKEAVNYVGVFDKENSNGTPTITYLNLFLEQQ